MSALVPFPSRIRFVNPDGTLTMEALKLLEILRERVGGTLGDIGADVFGAPEPLPPAGQDVLQQMPAEDALADMVMQPVAVGCAVVDVVQQAPDYSAGTGLALANYRFSLADTTVAPGSYGDATHVAKFTVDQQGRITSAESVSISFPQPSGANYTGSLTGKTVAISNGIITAVT